QPLHAATRQGAAIIALAIVWLASDVAATLFGRLSYITIFNFYAISGVVVLWLSLQFLSRSDRRFPKPHALDRGGPDYPTEAEAAPTTPSPPRLDLAQIEAKVREGQWHFDQDLTLGELARRVGTNASALSAALNAREEGNFTSFINGLRVEAVCDKLRGVGDAGDTGGGAAPNFLDLALDCGFGSKATFNRAFKRHTGLSPREWLQANRALEAA
ncbi:MAG: AraC family transcriptional regulator, partial [Pseudomonadota bacterium]